MTRLVHSFTATPSPTLAEVGGKGLSLIRMTHAGPRHPARASCSRVAFFAPWLDALAGARPSGSASRRARRRGRSRSALATRSRRACGALSFSAEPGRRARATRSRAFPAGGLFAVRSSSPEEDLEGSSFAGGYETVLGVSRGRLEAAVRRAFASCLDARVAVYKREHGFDPASPRIAVVVQQQIASEVAGVGFSLEPGHQRLRRGGVQRQLGPRRDGGRRASPRPISSPSTRSRRQVTGRQVGKKETSIWLTPRRRHRGAPRSAPRRARPSPTRRSSRSPTSSSGSRRSTASPWTSSGPSRAAGSTCSRPGRSPRTSRCRPTMVTAPGAPKRLYWDVTISVQGFFEPLSPMASDWSATPDRQRLRGSSSGATCLADPSTRRPSLVQHGRLYVNLSNVLMFARLRDPGRLRSPPSTRSLARPRWRRSTRRSTARLRRSQEACPVELLLQRAPSASRSSSRRGCCPSTRGGACERELERDPARRSGSSPPSAGPSATSSTRRSTSSHGRMMFEEVLPLFVVLQAGDEPDPRDLRGRHARAAAAGLEARSVAPRQRDRRDGPRARRARPDSCPRGRSALERASSRGSRPARCLPAFLQGWEEFLARYGHRGPARDRRRHAALPRAAADAALADRRQLAQGVGSGGHPSGDLRPEPARAPRGLRERSRRSRTPRAGSPAQRFQSLYRVVENLGRLRETPKFYLILAIDLAPHPGARRGRARWSPSGRLDRARAGVRSRVDGSGRAGSPIPRWICAPAAPSGGRPSDRLARFRELPAAVRLARAGSSGRRRRRSANGELAGHPISPGVVRGPVKVLHTPDEKPLLPGEILVARATDPGWTPLFVNAAAVILEVGGVMQHGALVAREYGKPCVAGVEAPRRGSTTAMMVEVDGAAGIVRFVQ